MTSLVQSASSPRLVNSEPALRDFVQMDIAFTQRKPHLPFQHTQHQRFVILDEDANRPEELKEPEFRDIKVSAIRLSATTESLLKLQRAFEVHGDVCHDGCKFEELRLRDCRKVSAIFYTVITHVPTHRY